MSQSGRRLASTTGIRRTDLLIQSQAPPGVREQSGAGVPWVAKMNEETLVTIRAQLDEAAFAEAWDEGRALTVEDAAELALDALG